MNVMARPLNSRIYSLALTPPRPILILDHIQQQLKSGTPIIFKFKLANTGPENQKLLIPPFFPKQHSINAFPKTPTSCEGCRIHPHDRVFLRDCC